MTSRRLQLVLLSLALIAPLALPASAGPEDPWTFEGGGWGHGVGLSQYGALGQAQDGKSAEQILQFYYRGTALDQMPAGHWSNDPDGLWVGLVSNTGSVTIEGTAGSVQLCQPADCSHASQVVAQGERYYFEVNQADTSQCRIRRKTEPAGPHENGYGPCRAVVTGLSPSARTKVGGIEYARGSIRMDPSPAGFHVVATMDMETYLLGLSEVPSSWPDAALRAQAIIGRSYALATAHARGGQNGQGKLSSCGCHLRDTSSDQVYAGWSKEAGSYGGNWRSAVENTEGSILTHPDSPYAFKVAKAFYSSSNGGASENVEDVWGGDDLPWLRSAGDPWSSDPAVNPLATWSVQVTNANMGAYFGWDKVYDATILEGPPGVLVRFDGKDDGKAVSAVLNGTQIRSLLNSYGFNYSSPGTSSTSVRVSPYISGVFDPPVPFNDVEGSVFEDAIEWLYEEGITVGCNPPSNTLYCVNGKVTRGEMGVFISRVIPLPAPKGDHFTDDDGMFWEGGANRMYESGISVGCGGTRYCGARVLPREQMAVFLVRALDLPPATKDYFVDDENSQFEDHINRIAEAKITLGCNPPANNRFCPKDTVTRGEMAAFFKRAWGK